MPIIGSHKNVPIAAHVELLEGAEALMHRESQLVSGSVHTSPRNVAEKCLQWT